MGRVAKFGVGVEILGTLGIAIILAIHGFHHGLGFLFSTQGATHASTNVYGVGFGGSWLSAALIAVLAPVYIFYGFESCGDIAEETKDAGTKIPKAMRWALIWGGIGSLILTAALLLAMPKNDPIKATFDGGGVPAILGQLSSGMQDFLLLLIIFAFFSCGSAVQGAGSRLAFSFARDGALPGSGWLSKVHSRFRTPVNALITGAADLGAVRAARLLPAVAERRSRVHHVPGEHDALYSLVSFAVSGIYLSFLLAVIAAIIARSRGWVPEGAFTARTLGLDGDDHRRRLPRADAAERGRADRALTSGRALFNLDWITLLVMVIIAVVGALYFFIARPDRKVGEHIHDTLEPTGAERVGV